MAPLRPRARRLARACCPVHFASRMFAWAAGCCLAYSAFLAAAARCLKHMMSPSTLPAVTTSSITANVPGSPTVCAKLTSCKNVERHRLVFGELAVEYLQRHLGERIWFSPGGPVQGEAMVMASVPPSLAAAASAEPAIQVDSS
jgi:hypothetical protein